MKQFTESHVFTGLRRDLSVSKHPANYLYDAQNIRITARDDDTLLSVTNERGTEDTMISVSGEYVGHCLLNDYLVVFSTITKSNKDYITRIDLSNEDVGKAKTVLYGDSLSHGSLGFSTDYPIDAIASYESEHIQKVYWTDGKNQPRIINISPSMDNKIESYNEYSFDFVPVLKLNETVTIRKGVGEGGTFASGVIQYAFTYYRQYGQESNIFYVSPLLYISPKDRGAAPDEKVENVFHIKVTGLDHNFDFLRIYSIHRTSINATPIVKRVQDLSLRGLNGKALGTLSFTDTGYEGDSIDPTELLYKGGLPITAKTLDQKDGTLFLGNIKMVNEAISVGSELKSIIQTEVDKIHVKGFSLESDSRYCYMEGSPSGGYDYFSQLTAYNHDSSALEKSSVPCGGFKAGDYYRCGVQFQHESGRWTDPIFLKDYRVEQRSVMEKSNEVKLSVIKGHLTSNICTSLIASGFKKVRAIVVYPEMQDRNVLCQGVTCPTVFTRGKREADKNLYGQSSWFFRPKYIYYDDGSGTISPTGAGAYETTTSSSTTCIGKIPYCEVGRDPRTFRQVEIQGSFDKDNNQFRTDGQFLTFHSPDVEFDEGLQLVDFSGTFAKKVGDVKFTNTFSDIDLQTESPTISNNGSGFTHKSFVKTKSYGICAGLFWDDFMVDDNEGFEAFTHEQSPYKWLVYPWHRTGSLNNDVNRPADKGTRTALLRKKIISNLRYAETDWDLISKNTWNSQAGFCNFSKVPKLFSSNEVSIVKWGDALYQGNVDTALSPDNPDSLYFAFEGDSYKDVKTTYFDSPIEWRTYPGEYSDNNKRHSIQKYDNGQWVSNSDAVGNDFQDLVQTKDAVRMKYKSTAHLVFETSFNNYIIPGTGDKSSSLNEESIMALVEIIRGYGYRDTMFGGKTPDALKANVWIPCGEPETLSSEGTDFWYSYGDSYIQRWDCLKTYPFTPEDPNQIVEIGSFVLESRVNIDGRYDRNRGQLSNINMSPTNFNLLNPVYGQQNNFFTYRIQDDDFYKNVDYPNQVTWTKTKQDGADTDLWTNITLASTYSMDGSKGGVESLNVWKDQIYCFQDRGISNILFNSRVQIPTSDGVPIEISNSYKVDGYRYLSDGIGCSDHRLIQETPSGIYFIDSMNNHLFQITDSLQDLSESHNMTTWFNDGRDSYCRVVYDSLHHDVYVVQGDGGKALCFSEKLNEFTSFMDYADISLMETSSHHVFSMKDSRLFRMFEGKYNDFFGVYSGNDYLPHLYPWSLTFISSGASNQLTAYDKIFTNLEFRAIVEGDGIFTEEADPVTGEGRKKLTEFLLPFDYLETWNEYQHGFTTLENKRGHAAFLHHQDNTSSLKRKFRIWRCDIPRDNTSKSGAGITGVFDATFDYTFGNSGNRRVTVNRMRNPWLFLKLQKNVESGTSGLPKTELHDIQVKYFV